MNIEFPGVERKESFKLVPAERCIPGLDEEMDRSRIRDLSYLSDKELLTDPPKVNKNIGTPLYCKNDTFKRDLGAIDKDGIAELKEIFRGQVLVDIGSGGNFYGADIAEMFHAKGYVGVELYDFLRARQSAGTHNRNIPIALVAEDALTFLRRIPDKSDVSVLLSNMNVSVLPSVSMREEISREIKRVISPRGGVLIYKSDFFVGDPDLTVHYISRGGFPDIRVGTFG